MTVPPRVGPPPSADAAVIDGVNVDAVAAAVLACPGVGGLDGGRFGEVASYLPGRRVPGVLVNSGAITVQVRSRWAVPAAGLLSQITAALRPLAGGRPVRVVIGDIDVPPSQESGRPRAAGAAGTAAGMAGPAAGPTAPL